MTNAELYNTIFLRRSIRKFDMTPLAEETLNDLKNFANSIKPLNETIKYEFSYLSTDHVKNIFPIKAPHYICIYSENKEGYRTNAGYILQHIDLYLSFHNLASCWLGMAKPSNDVPEVLNGKKFVIMIAFGNTPEPLHRSNVSEFRRKNLSDITNISGMDDILEAVRLAPSASNTQTWYLSGNTTEITVSHEKLNLIKAPLYSKFNQIDIGIALCHLHLALQNSGKTATFDFNSSIAPKGYEFMLKVKVGGNESC